MVGKTEPRQLFPVSWRRNGTHGDYRKLRLIYLLPYGSAQLCCKSKYLTGFSNKSLSSHFPRTQYIFSRIPCTVNPGSQVILRDLVFFLNWKVPYTGSLGTMHPNFFFTEKKCNNTQRAQHEYYHLIDIVYWTSWGKASLFISISQQV